MGSKERTVPAKLTALPDSPRGQHHKILAGIAYDRRATLDKKTISVGDDLRQIISVNQVVELMLGV